MEKATLNPALLGIAIRAALAAGKDIRQIYNDPAQDFGIERKADNSPLTLADKAAHSCIMLYLAETGIPVLSEEGSQIPYEERKQWEAFWLVDPLDGTKEFIKKNGEFTVNIALIINGRPHLGVIYVPILRTLYFAEPLLGAYKLTDISEWADTDTLPLLVQRAQLLPMPQPEKGDTYVVVASRSHMTSETEAFVTDVRKQHPVVEIRNSGSSIKLCLVAEGVADVYPRYSPTMEWDTAAGHAIALCAGCQVTEAGTDQPLSYNKPDLHNPWFQVERQN